MLELISDQAFSITGRGLCIGISMRTHGLTQDTLPKKGDKVLWKGNVYTYKHFEGFANMWGLKDDVCFCIFQSDEDKQMNHYSTTPLYSSRLSLALLRASEWHQYQSRFNGFPYLYHLLRVAGYVGEMTKDEDVVIGALLHDSVEDGKHYLPELKQYVGIELTELEDIFGPNVANLVAFITEDKSAPKDVRKNEYINNLRSPDCPIGSLIISICDKYDSLQYYQSERHLVTPDVINFMGELLCVYREKVESGVLVSEGHWNTNSYKGSKSYVDLLSEMEVLLDRLRD